MQRSSQNTTVSAVWVISWLIPLVLEVLLLSGVVADLFSGSSARYDVFDSGLFGWWVLAVVVMSVVQGVLGSAWRRFMVVMLCGIMGLAQLTQVVRSSERNGLEIIGFLTLLAVLTVSLLAGEAAKKLSGAIRRRR